MSDADPAREEPSLARSQGPVSGSTVTYPPPIAYQSFDEHPSFVTLSAPGPSSLRLDSDVLSQYWHLFRRRSRYYIPILRWLPRYDYRRDLMHDCIAGVTVAMLLIPQSLSYASGLAQLDPVFGLYSCFIPLMIYGFLGTSRQLAVGPEALISLLVGNAIKDLTAKDQSVVYDRTVVAATLSFLVGIMTFMLGLTRLGFLDSVMSRALLRGFVTAVACVILIEQMPALLGLRPLAEGTQTLINPSSARDVESPFLKFLSVLQHLPETNGITFVLSLSAVVFLLGFARLKLFLAKKYEHLTVAEQQLPSEAPPSEEQHFSAPAESSNMNFLPKLDEARIEDPLSFQPLAFTSTADKQDPKPSVSGGLFSSWPSNTQAPSNEEDSASTPRTRLPLAIQFIFFIPEILLVVTSSILLSYALNLHDKHHVDILGEDALKSGFRQPQLPLLKSGFISTLLTPAVLISVLGFVESIVVVKKYGAKYNYTVSANRELVAFGIVNLLGSITSCFATFSSMARSQVSDTAGAKTQLSGMVAGLIILLTILFLLPLFYWLPKCVMASIVLVAAVGLLEFDDVRFMWKIRAWSDLLMMALTFFITIFWSVEAGVFISIALSLILVVKHSTYPKISVLGRVMETIHDEVSGTDKVKIKFKPLEEIATTPGLQTLPEDHEILVVRIEESLFFANTGQMKDRLRRAEAYEGRMHVHPSEEERRPKARRPFEQDFNKKEHLEFRKRRVEELRAARGRIAAAYDKETPEFFPQSLDQSPTRSIAVDERSPLLARDQGEDYDVLLRAVIFDIENMPHIDASAIQILTEIVHEYHARGITVCFAKLRDANKPIFLQCGLLGGIVGSDHFFRKISDAMLFLHEQWHWDEAKAVASEVGRDSLKLGPDEPAAAVVHSNFSTYSFL